MSNPTSNRILPATITVLNRPPKSLTFGVDLGDKRSYVVVLDKDGEVIGRGFLPTTQSAFGKFFAKFAGARVAYEVGTHSRWISLVLESIGCETVVANPHKLQLISQSNRKNDANDAELLARIGRVDPTLLSPIKHRAMDNYAAQAVLRARDTLVRARNKLTNCTRGLVKPVGGRISPCGTASFHKQALEQIPEELHEAVSPLIEMLASLSEKIRAYDKLIKELGEKRYPQATAFQQVSGVGPISSLAFVLVVEDPTRFTRSRDVGAYLGLVPKQRESGNQSPELRISKAGDSFTRRMLVQCAHHILGHRGPDCDLRRAGRAIEATGKKLAKKKAVVAVARKLAVLLHRMWVTGEEYEPLRNANRTTKKKSA